LKDISTFQLVICLNIVVFRKQFHLQ